MATKKQFKLHLFTGTNDSGCGDVCESVQTIANAVGLDPINEISNIRFWLASLHVSIKSSQHKSFKDHFIWGFNGRNTHRHVSVTNTAAVAANSAKLRHHAVQVREQLRKDNNVVAKGAIAKGQL